MQNGNRNNGSNRCLVRVLDLSWMDAISRAPGRTAPAAWRDYAEDDQYVAVSETERYDLVDISEADKFTKEEAEILMDKLRVNWELVEVRENAWNK